MKKPDTSPTDVENAEPSAPSSARHLIAVAATLVAAPLLLATPSADEADAARAELAFLRAVTASKTEQVSHPLLQRAMALAVVQQSQESGTYQQFSLTHYQDFAQMGEDGEIRTGPIVSK